MQRNLNRHGYACLIYSHTWEYHRRPGYLLAPYRHCIHCNTLQKRRTGILFFLFDTVGTYFKYTR